MVYCDVYESPMGRLFLSADGEGLTSLCFERQGMEARREADGAGAKAVREARRWLDLYFLGKVPDFLPPLHLLGSDFQQAVWQRLLSIPYGTVRTYGEIARELSRRRGTLMAAQAVGGAVGRNPIAIIVPCHRVVGAHGNLTGYAAGLAKKKALLALEGLDMSRFWDSEKEGL